MKKEGPIVVEFVESESVPEGRGEYSKESAIFSYNPSMHPPERKEILPGIYEQIKCAHIVVGHLWVRRLRKNIFVTDLSLGAHGEDLVVYSFDGRCGRHEVLIDKTMTIEKPLPKGNLHLSMENFPISERGAMYFLSATKKLDTRYILNPLTNLWCIEFQIDTSNIRYVQIGSSAVAGIDSDKYLCKLFITNIRLTNE